MGDRWIKLGAWRLLQKWPYVYGLEVLLFFLTILSYCTMFLLGLCKLPLTIGYLSRVAYIYNYYYL